MGDSARLLRAFRGCEKQYKLKISPKNSANARALIAETVQSLYEKAYYFPHNNSATKIYIKMSDYWLVSITLGLTLERLLQLYKKENIRHIQKTKSLLEDTNSLDAYIEKIKYGGTENG